MNYLLGQWSPEFEMLDIPQVLLADAAEATGVEFNTLRNWIARGAIDLSPSDQRAQGRGGRHILTMRTVYGIAVMKELTSYGLSPGQAGSTAHLFVRNLAEGLLFPDGTTLLMVFKPPAPSRSVSADNMLGHPSHMRLVHARTDDDYRKVFSGTFIEEGSAIIVDCNSVFSRIDRAHSELRENRRAGEGRRR